MLNLLYIEAKFYSFYINMGKLKIVLETVEATAIMLNKHVKLMKQWLNMSIQGQDWPFSQGATYWAAI